MLTIEKAVFPDPEQWKMVTLGMRNAMNSWDKSDSYTTGPNVCNTFHDGFEIKGKHYNSSDLQAARDEVSKLVDPGIENPTFILGYKDLKLMKDLCSADSPEHAKFLRQLPVILDIKAPLYWWKQMDQYKVGTVTNSCSTMHKLTDKEFESEDFSIYPVSWGYTGNDMCLDFDDEEWLLSYIERLNDLRDQYNKTKDEKYWYAINDRLFQSYNQKRTWSANYAVLKNICRQRKGHKLKEWKTFIDWVHDNAPYAAQLIFNEWE